MPPALFALPTARLVTWTWHPDDRCVVVPSDAEKALGRALAAAFEQPDWAFVHPADAPRLEAALQRCLRDSEPIEEAVRVHPDVGSSVTWLEVHATCTDTADGPRLQGVFLDGTRRRLAEVARERHETRHRLIMDSAREYAILTLAHDGTITGWSIGATRLFGYAESEAIGLPSAALFNEDDVAAGVPQREIDRALTRGRVKDERWHRRKDGTRFFGSGLLMRMEGDDESSRLLKILRDRTFEEQARRALAESQERLRLATDAAGLGVFEWNVETRTALWENARMYEIFGRNPDDGPLSPDEAAARIAPEDLEPMRAALTAHAATGQPLHLHLRLRSDNAAPPRQVEVWGRFRPDDDGRRTRLIGVLADVTVAREREQALRESEARFRLATEAVNGLIYDMDLRTGAVWRSESLHALIGIPAAEAEPTAAWWTERIHPEDRGKAWEAYDRLACRGASRYDVEYRVRHRDGHYVQVWDQALVECTPDGTPVRVLGCSVDVTPQREAEAALVEADRRKDAFLATLAHELRNPLAPLRHALEILRRPDAPPDATVRAREVAERQLAQMVRLIDDLLDLSRITLGKIGLRHEVVAIHDVVRAAIETCQPMLDASHQRLALAIPADPIHVSGDPVRLAQILTNLVNNASKFSPEGATVHVRVTASPDEVSCEVQDHGIGIEAEERPHIFEMFAQGTGRSTQRRSGLGVGLALAKQLVDMHGGRIRAESDGRGRGSTFTLTLPREAGTAAATGPHREAEVTTTMKRVLVVDDNLDSAESLSLLLELMGHVVRTAHDGEQALAEAEAFRPELVLMDIGMPRMDGYEAARRLRQAEWSADTILVALTGWGQDEDKRRSEAAGFNHHLIKPVDPAALETLLRTAAG